MLEKHVTLHPACGFHDRRDFVDALHDLARCNGLGKRLREQDEAACARISKSFHIIG